MNQPNTIYEFVIQEENRYNTNPIEIISGWSWSMKNHIEKSILYKNSQFTTGKDDNKPFKNITRPLLNLQYRAEGFDVKDIELFVNDSSQYYKSFLIRKFHEKWARENKIDTFIDEMVESYVDFGGALIKNVKGVRPEVVPLHSIAFADQSDLMSGPIAFRHYFSASELAEMADVGWGDPSNGATATLEEVILQARTEKNPDKGQSKSYGTPGEYIEVYEIHGNLPSRYLKGSDKEYENQFQIITFLHKENEKERGGITLYAKKEEKSPFKLVLRDEIRGRALGLGGAEELFEPQVWINYDSIRMKSLLDEAARIIYKTTDASFASRNKTYDLETGEILVLADGKDLAQVDNFPRNQAAFTRDVESWEAHARQMSGASEAILGESPSAGTPFKLQELVAAEAHSLHEYRKGKLATFLDQIYQDWIVPHISREITKGHEFLAELELDELQEISDTISTNQANQMAKERILNGQQILPEEMELFKQEARENFMKKGNKRFIKILEKEFKRSPISVKVNIVGKQKDLPGKVDKLVNIFRQIVANPQVLQSPPMAKLFNQILEFSGLNPIDFSGFTLPQQLEPSQPELEAPKMQKMPIPVAT